MTVASRTPWTMPVLPTQDSSRGQVVRCSFVVGKRVSPCKFMFDLALFNYGAGNILRGSAKHLCTVVYVLHCLLLVCLHSLAINFEAFGPVKDRYTMIFAAAYLHPQYSMNVTSMERYVGIEGGFLPATRSSCLKDTSINSVVSGAGHTKENRCAPE